MKIHNIRPYCYWLKKYKHLHENTQHSTILLMAQKYKHLHENTQHSTILLMTQKV